jgi:hypothetical protein
MGYSSVGLIWPHLPQGLSAMRREFRTAGLTVFLFRRLWHAHPLPAPFAEDEPAAHGAFMLTGASSRTGARERELLADCCGCNREALDGVCCAGVLPLSIQSADLHTSGDVPSTEAGQHLTAERTVPTFAQRSDSRSGPRGSWTESFTGSEAPSFSGPLGWRFSGRGSVHRCPKPVAPGAGRLARPA